MKIILITPATKQSKAGNRTTAVRWASLLREIGHRVVIQSDWDGSPADMMVAIHAWRSASSIERFNQKYSENPLLVLLSGTDIYSYQHSHPKETLNSMAKADALLCLHDLVHEAIPQEFIKKLHVIHQSALPLKRQRSPSKRTFDVCVLGHLREVKDSLRCAYAVRNIPKESRIRVIHLGKAHNDEWENAARVEMENNNRYLWRGEVDAWRVRQEFVKTHLMVLSSIVEGGANVISEAIVAGVPIIASKIDGNVGLLGKDYPGYYPPKDTEALTSMLLQAETDQSFMQTLKDHGAKRKHLFRREREREAWKVLLEKF